MATTPTSRETPPVVPDAPLQADLRRALSSLIPIIVGLLLAEFFFERIRGVGRRFGERHPLLSALAHGGR